MVVGSFAGSTPIFINACSCAGDKRGLSVFGAVFVLTVPGVEVGVMTDGEVRVLYSGRRLNGSAMNKYASTMRSMKKITPNVVKNPCIIFDAFDIETVYT